MVIWYRNSVLASIVSIVGCVIVITGVSGLLNKEIGAGAGILLIIAGIGIAALGKVISVMKAQKKREQAQRAQGGGQTGSTARYSGNTGTAQGSTSQNTGNTGYTYGSTSQNTGNTGYTYGNTTQNAGNTGYAYGNSSQNTGNAGYTYSSTSQNTGNTGYTYRSASQTTGNTQRQLTKEEIQALRNIIKLAESYAEKEEYDKELDTLLSGLSIDPENAELLNQIGRAYRHVGDYNAALDYYFRSAKADPNNLSIGSNIATAYMFLGEYEKADHYFQGEIRRLEAVHSQEAKDVLAIAYANYALCVGRMGDLNKARDYLSKAEQTGYKKCDVIWNMLMKA